MDDKTRNAYRQMAMDQVADDESYRFDDDAEVIKAEGDGGAFVFATMCHDWPIYRHTWIHVAATEEE